MTYSGDRTAICGYEGIHVYNAFGEFLWGIPVLEGLNIGKRISRIVKEIDGLLIR